MQVDGADDADRRSDDSSRAPTRSGRGAVDLQLLIRVLVPTAVILVAGFALVGVAEALRTFDRQADKAASVTYVDRLYGAGGRYRAVIRDKTVVEEAMATMPADARFRVLVGRDWKPVVRSRWTTSIEADFLNFHLFPRRLTDSTSAEWAFCLRCNLSDLGPKVDVVSRGSDGMLFVRILR